MERHGMVYYLLTFLSILLETGKNVFSNNFSKNVLKNDTDIYKFNTFLNIGSLLVLLCTGNYALSGYTVALAFLFAAVTALSQVFLLKALSIGSMAYTSFIQGSNLVIPALFGVLFLHSPVKMIQLIALPILLVAMALVLGVFEKKAENGNKSFSVRWLVFALLSMLFTGGIGILQTIHQNSSHSAELTGFLICTFAFAVLFNLLLWRVRQRKEPATFSVKANALIQAALSGIFMGIVNLVNLYLSGVMPTIIFFPLVNGGLIIATILSAVLFFRERLRLPQWIGIVLGVAAMCMLSI